MYRLRWTAYRILSFTSKRLIEPSSQMLAKETSSSLGLRYHLHCKLNNYLMLLQAEHYSSQLRKTLAYSVHNRLVLNSLLIFSVCSLTEKSRDLHTRDLSYHYILPPGFLSTKKYSYFWMKWNVLFIQLFPTSCPFFSLSPISLPAFCSQTPSVNGRNFSCNKPTTN
jgi:hypothetical protein